jgi:hypothetical protein
MDSVYGSLPGLGHAHLNHPMGTPTNNGFATHYQPNLASIAAANNAAAAAAAAAANNVLNQALLNNQAAALHSGVMLNSSSNSSHSMNNGGTPHAIDVKHSIVGGSPGIVPGMDHSQMNTQVPPPPPPQQQSLPPPQSVLNGNPSGQSNQWPVVVNGNADMTMEDEKRDKDAIYGYDLFCCLFLHSCLNRHHVEVLIGCAPTDSSSLSTTYRLRKGSHDFFRHLLQFAVRFTLDC